MEELDRADWQAYCQGDDAAFARIYRRHKDHLLSYCVYAGHAREVGEDIVQETFSNLVRQRERGKEIGCVKNWLFICARNLSLTLLKRQKRERQTTHATAGNPGLTNAAALEVSISAASQTELAPEVRHFLQNVLSRLDPEDRELILLREYHGFATGELAAMFAISEEAVRVRLYRIRKRMCELGKEYR